MQVILRRLFAFHGPDCIHVDKAQLLIGRGEDCHFSPATPLLSRRHCEIVIDNERWCVRDLGSRNGTYVNSERVEGSRELRTGDVLNVGLAFYEVHLVDDAETDRTDSRHSNRLTHLFGAWITPLSSSC
jgi:predicted component of type VI protein secretion system